MSDPIPSKAPEITFAQCGGSKCDHDFFGPGSLERAFDNGSGSERICARCGTGALATMIWGDFF